MLASLPGYVKKGGKYLGYSLFIFFILLVWVAAVPISLILASLAVIFAVVWVLPFLIIALCFEYCFIPLDNWFYYVIHYKNHLDELRHGVERLLATRAALRQEAEGARRRGMGISRVVEAWEAEVRVLEEDKKSKLDDVVGDRGCPFNPWKTFALSKTAFRLLERVDDLRDPELLRNVSDPPPPPRLGTAFVGAAPKSHHAIFIE